MRPCDLGASGPLRLQLGRLSPSRLPLLPVPPTLYSSPPTPRSPSRPLPTSPHCTGASFSPMQGSGRAATMTCHPGFSLILGVCPKSSVQEPLYSLVGSHVEWGRGGFSLSLHPFFPSSFPLLVPRPGTSEDRANGQIGRGLGPSSSSCPNLLCDLGQVPCLLWVSGNPS